MVAPWHNRQTGFTLLELLIVITIIGIITAFAYPSMQQQIAKMRVKDAVNMAEVTFKQARSDALVARAEVNTAINTVAKTLTVIQMQNSVASTQTVSFNPQIKITPINNMPTDVTFTPTKRALNKLNNTPMKAVDESNPNTLIGYEFCYNNISTEKYVITIDALTNVKVIVSGVCP